MASPPEQVLSWYPPFAISLTAGRRYSIAWSAQANAVVAVVFGAAFLVTASVEKTLIMRGDAVGLLEHPGIWVFLVAQIVVPWTVTRSLRAIRTLPLTGSAPLAADFLHENFEALD